LAPAHPCTISFTALAATVMVSATGHCIFNFADTTFSAGSYDSFEITHNPRMHPHTASRQLCLHEARQRPAYHLVGLRRYSRRFLSDMFRKRELVDHSGFASAHFDNADKPRRVEHGGYF
jgi:hypothetical protein